MKKPLKQATRTVAIVAIIGIFGLSGCVSQEVHIGDEKQCLPKKAKIIALNKITCVEFKTEKINPE